jgi:hypothetical protein
MLNKNDLGCEHHSNDSVHGPVVVPCQHKSHPSASMKEEDIIDRL